jgi:hypothetical protein
MKNINKKTEIITLIILGCLTLFWSCRENITSNIILNPKIQKFNKFPINSVGKIIHLKSAIFSKPEFVTYYDSMLLFTFIYPKNDLIGAYLLKSEEYKPIILTGRGPNEGISAAGIGTNKYQKELWFYDDVQKNISFTPLNKLFDNKQKITHKEQIPDDSFWNIEMLNDSIYLAFASKKYPKKKITIINPYTHKVVNRVGDYYKINGCPIEGVSEVFFASVIAKPEGDRFACAYKKTDVIEIYNASGNLIYSVQGPDCFNANYKIDAVTATHVKYHAIGEKRKAYNSLNATSKYIYGLYNYRYIHVFDWNGSPIKRITLSQNLEEQITAFCVDNHDTELYYYSETYGRFCKINLLSD